MPQDVPAAADVHGGATSPAWRAAAGGGGAAGALGGGDGGQVERSNLYLLAGRLLDWDESRAPPARRRQADNRPALRCARDDGHRARRHTKRRDHPGWRLPQELLLADAAAAVGGAG